MHIWLALGVALLAGCSDFTGGYLARQAPTMAVSAVAHGSGFFFMVALALVIGGDPTGGDLIYGSLAGIGSAIGLVSVYHGYAHSRVAIVAPVAGVGATAVPVVFAALTGEPFSGRETVGIVLGLVAIGLVSMARGDQRDSVVRALGFGLLGAAGLGGLLLAFGQGSEDGGVWIVVPSRVTGFVVLVAMLRLRNTRVRLPRSIVPMVVMVAVASSSANAMYTEAARLGPLATVAVVASMFPAVTVALAWLVFRERLGGRQMVGMILALLSVGLMAAG